MEEYLRNMLIGVFSLMTAGIISIIAAVVYLVRYIIRKTKQKGKNK